MLVNIICFHVGGVRLYGVWRWWCWYGVVAGDGGLELPVSPPSLLRSPHCLLDTARQSSPSHSEASKDRGARHRWSGPVSHPSLQGEINPDLWKCGMLEIQLLDISD